MSSSPEWTTGLVEEAGNDDEEETLCHFFLRQCWSKLYSGYRSCKSWSTLVTVSKLGWSSDNGGSWWASYKQTTKLCVFLGKVIAHCSIYRVSFAGLSRINSEYLSCQCVVTCCCWLLLVIMGVLSSSAHTHCSIQVQQKEAIKAEHSLWLDLLAPFCHLLWFPFTLRHLQRCDKSHSFIIWPVVTLSVNLFWTTFHGTPP